MALPLRDILTVEKSKATRFGHHGLIIIIRGHEELFFEFGAEDRRNAFVTLLEAQVEDVNRRIAAGDAHSVSAGAQEAIILEDIPSDGGHKPSPTDNMTDSLPAVMFTSASSTFLTFKPPKSIHFTFLTIGSRGDVQPYISLAKGLMADGHRVRIATHGEFQEWIESVGCLCRLLVIVLHLTCFSMESNTATSVEILQSLCVFVWTMECLRSLS